MSCLSQTTACCEEDNATWISVTFQDKGLNKQVSKQAHTQAERDTRTETCTHTNRQEFFLSLGEEQKKCCSLAHHSGGNSRAPLKLIRPNPHWADRSFGALICLKTKGFGVPPTDFAHHATGFPRLAWLGTRRTPVDPDEPIRGSLVQGNARFFFCFALFCSVAKAKDKESLCFWRWGRKLDSAKIHEMKPCLSTIHLYCAN